jgi:hypothetical protein
MPVRLMSESDLIAYLERRRLRRRQLIIRAFRLLAIAGAAISAVVLLLRLVIHFTGTTGEIINITSTGLIVHHRHLVIVTAQVGVVLGVSAALVLLWAAVRALWPAK